MSVFIEVSKGYEYFCEMKDQFITELEFQQKDCKTIDNYQRVIDGFLEFVYAEAPNLSIQQLTHRTVIEFIRYSESKYNEKQLKNNSSHQFTPYTFWTNSAYKKAIKLFINFIEEENDLQSAIKWNKIQFKKEQTEIKSLSNDDQNKLLKYLTNLYKRYSMTKNKSNLPTELKSYEYICMLNFTFKLGVFGGLRASEICSLTLNSFSKPYIDNKFLIIDITVDGKGHKQRIVPILYKHIQKELEFYQSNKDHHKPMFASIKGGQLTRYSLYQYLESASKYAKVQSRGVHILRHTCAMNMRECGVDLADAQDFLGHSDPSVTRIYFKKSQSAMRRVAARM